MGYPPAACPSDLSLIWLFQLTFPPDKKLAVLGFGECFAKWEARKMTGSDREWRTWKELQGNERKGSETINLSEKVGPLDLVPPYNHFLGLSLRCQFLTECRPTSLPLLRNGKPTARVIWHGKARWSEAVFVGFICWYFRSHARHPGWFYVKSPPSPERSMLMGTFGTNDASTLYSGSSRRGTLRRAISRWSPEMAERSPQIVISHPLLCVFFFSHSISPSLATTLQFCNLQLAGIQPHGDVQLWVSHHTAAALCFRRRHGAIWINDDGKLGMSTNTGTLLNLNWIESWEIFRCKPPTIKQRNGIFSRFWRIWQYWKLTSWSLSKRNV